MSNELHDNFAIIIPAYNEAERISATITEIRRYSDADIIVVSDGSTDNTAQEARGQGLRCRTSNRI